MSFLDPDHHTHDGRVALVTGQAEANPDDPEWKRVTDEIATVINSVDADTAYLDPKIVLEEFLAHLPAEMIEAVWFVIRYTYKISEDAIEKRRADVDNFIQPDKVISEEEEYTIKDAEANLQKYLSMRALAVNLADEVYRQIVEKEDNNE